MEDDLLVGNAIVYGLNFAIIQQRFESLGAPPEAVAAATVALAGFLDTMRGLSATTCMMSKTTRTRRPQSLLRGCSTGSRRVRLHASKRYTAI
jgi:hypothetical protein